MKALVKTEPAAGVELTDVPMPTVGPGEALVRVLRTGICGSDLHILHWDAWAQQNITPPLVVGHEFVGEVVEVAPGTRSVQAGDIVSGEGHIVCERCRHCRAGDRHLCAGTEGIGVHRAGAFAEYIAMPTGNLWRHPDDIDLDAAAIFDPFGNAVHTALKFPVHGEDVLITGAGPIGIMAALVAGHAGARNVVVTDVNPYRLELARSLGVGTTVDVTTTALEDVRDELGMAEGFDVGMEMSGDSRALHSMVDGMANGGRIAMLGLPSQQTTLDWSSIVLRMLTLTGIYGREMFETWYQASVLVEAGVDISRVVTHRFGHDEHAAAFEAAAGGNSGKVIMEWASR
ncbi:L-threonine 3-dehydrogenase [Haloactinopolyspora alba]|uniref:L-threonine 3-dehydrogenase n=1 Tax=Haloactinopolyspora alba TaxID=648780 RepID=A0A2P8E5M1_9ACTN|nr:L-threonine 3-dehydrogenase [Haloactinopolyspora alba]PSL04776.1 L-threonine 3-dehydrogenase [Haloactinopolyspora alba]